MKGKVKSQTRDLTLTSLSLVGSGWGEGGAGEGKSGEPTVERGGCAGEAKVSQRASGGGGAYRAGGKARPTPRMFLTRMPWLGKVRNGGIGVTKIIQGEFARPRRGLWKKNH